MTSESDASHGNQRTSKLLHRGTLSILDQGIVSVTSFVTLVLIGRLGGDEQLGIYALAFTLLWLAASIPNALIWTPFTVRMPRLKAEEQKLLQSSIAYHTTVYCLLMIVPTLLTLAWMVPFTPWLGFSSWVFVAGMTLREHLRRVRMVHLDMTGLLVFDAWVCSTQIISFAVLYYCGGVSAFSVMLSHGLIAGLPVTGIFLNIGAYRVGVAKAISDWQIHWESGRWLAGAALINAASEAFVRFAIASILGMQGLGRFTAAFSLPMVANPLVISLSNFLRVDMARDAVSDSPQQLQQSFWKNQVLCTALGLLLFGTIAALGGLGAQVTFGEKFDGLARPILAICAGLAVSMMCIPGEIALTSAGQTKTLLGAAIARFLVVMVVAWPAIHYLSLIGGGVAITAGFAIVLLIQLKAALNLLQDK
jgi:O-antigen/teichoic acid export membrane protein